MFLTKEEVRRLTGKKHRESQIAFLKAEDYTFRLDDDGHPVLASAHVEQKFGVKQGRHRAPFEPKFDGLRKRYGTCKAKQQTPAAAGVLRDGDTPLPPKEREAD